MQSSPSRPRKIGWFEAACLAVGGSVASLFTIGVLFVVQSGVNAPGTMAMPLLILGILLSYAAIPGWMELTLMFPKRVGGIAATCTEAFRPYSDVLSNLTGMCYWWGWAPSLGVSSTLGAAIIQQWFLPSVDLLQLATLFILIFALIALRGIKFTARVAIPIATVASLLALASGLIPILTGHINWEQATTFHLNLPFAGRFGELTSLMAGLYLIGYAAPAFENAFCYAGELKEPIKDQPRAVYGAAAVASLYFILLPLVWLGTAGPDKLAGDLIPVITPTLAPLFGIAAKSAAIWFFVFSNLTSLLATFSGATRTLSQLADDGLLPRIFSHRAPSGAPSVAIVFTMSISIILLWIGSPLWAVASSNFTYLIGICLPSIAVWLLRKNQPDLPRPWRAPRGTIMLGVIATLVWGFSAIFGFEQYGLPAVISGIAFAYTGAILYAWRKIRDHLRQGLPIRFHSLHVKLTGAMLLVLLLDATGYLIAVNHVPAQEVALLSMLADIFVTVAILTLSVGLVLPGMIANSATQVAQAANALCKGTMADFSRAMIALGKGDLNDAYARINIEPIKVYSQDEIGEMAESFNNLQWEIMRSATGLDRARAGLQQARDELVKANETLEQRVQERTMELENAQQKLLISARQAGMVEVAKNVLHNVGNALNSVNVSASLLQENITQSPLNNLTQVSSLIRENKDHLDTFITQDKRGAHLPDYLIALADYWKNEKVNINANLKTLLDNIEHIRSIIAMQQSLSGTSEFEQVVDPTVVVEDALKVAMMNPDNNSSITVIKQYGDSHPILIDRIKLMQILINLFRNAKDALNDSTIKNKLLTLKIEFVPNQKLIIEVTDNGIGIAPENLVRIFSHGFTTKKQGYGFGLHFCALAANEMKGELRVRSEGPGKGATFILELPYKKAE